MAVRFIGGTADQRSFHLKFKIEHVQNFDGFSDDFGANAITREDCDFHVKVWSGVVNIYCFRQSAASPAAQWLE